MNPKNEISLRLPVPDRRADQAFAALRDFANYPRLCPAVRRVDLESQSEHEAVSHWEVNFQSGILKWQERDRFDAGRREITFEQLAGDIEHFSGRWQVVEDAEGCQIHFDALFDLGIPMLADMLDPVARRAIEDNIRSIVAGLFPVQAGAPA